MHLNSPRTNEEHRSWISTNCPRWGRFAGILATGLLLGQPPALSGQGFGYLPLDSVPPDFAITPMGDSRVLVAWINKGQPNDTVLVGEYRNGFQADFDPQAIFHSTSQLTALKLEVNADEYRFLSVTEGAGINYSSRLLRYDPEYREMAQNLAPARSSYSPPGRMLGPDDRLFVSSSGASAAGRFVDGESLSLDFLIWIQGAVTDDDDDTDPYNTKSDPITKTVTASGLDTAIGSDGFVTAFYQLGSLRLKRYGPDRRLKKSLILERPPFSFFERTAMTAVAVNGSRTTLLAWEWHEHAIIGDDFRIFPSIPAFRAIMADGSKTETIRLEPASRFPDRYDRPAVGLRPDGTGAVAWTVRTAETSAVWLQRLDADLGAFEPPRLVDARPDFDTDLPMIETDEEGNLFLAWRCTPIDGEGAEIGILEISQLDRASAPPQVTCDAGKVRIDWINRPASRNSLWYSSDLNPDHAQQIHHDEGLPGPCLYEHAPTSPSGFYWLRSE